MTTLTDPPATALQTLRPWWDEGFTWDRFRDDEIVEHAELWNGVYRRSDTPEDVLDAIEELGRDWKLMAIAEDWCGDASNLVPIFARLAEASPRIELRIVKRDESPELMDLYLTNGSRSVPIVVIMDEEFRPVGRWGPRPAELQEFVVREKRAGRRPSSDIYRYTRRWYARDRGETTLREVVEIMAAV
jgi:DNA-binding transcriptional LysR family regulator